MFNVLRMSWFLWLISLVAAGHAAETACPPAPPRPTPELMQSAMRNATDHGYLWRITKDGHTSYLYGTMHVGKPEWLFPGPKVTAALRASNTLALELDVLDPEIAARTRKSMAALHPPALPDSLAKRMQQEAQALCVPYEALSGLVPEMQITVLGVIAARWVGLDATYATDSMLAAMGHRAKMNVVSLETPELQLQALVMKDPKETAAFVQDGLDELESSRTRELQQRQAAAWANSDYAEMEHYADWCECLKTDIEREVMKRLLDQRNPGMAEHIDALHESGKRVFAAVGSLHLFGPMGLPALMEKRGYAVERMDLKAEAKKTTGETR